MFRADIVKTNKKGRIYRKRFERIRKVRENPLDIGKEREYFSLQQFHTPNHIRSDRGAADKSTLVQTEQRSGTSGKGDAAEVEIGSCIGFCWFVR